MIRHLEFKPQKKRLKSLGLGIRRLSSAQSDLFWAVIKG